MAINKQQLQALDDLIDSIDDFKVEQDPVNEFLKRVKRNLEEFGFVASGNMFQSLKALPSTKKGKNISEVNIEAEDYWQDLENGTKPKGFSKEERKKLQPKILEWIKSKPSLQELAGSVEKQRSLSYAIATNILKNGTIKRFGYRGKPFLTQEIPQLKEDIIKQWQ
jgi:hypothetical protein